MMSAQESFPTKEAAIARARQLVRETGDDSFVVIESWGKFYVENGGAMLRTWEREVWSAEGRAR